MDSALDILKERGFLQDISDEDGLRDALQAPVTFYSGFDPTGPSLHVGHLVSIMAMRVLQRCGHVPIALVGGGTARIGDPSGKVSARPMLSGEEIDSNGERFREQLSRYLALDSGQGMLLNNREWLLPLSLIPFLRDIGRHFSVNQMLSAEVYKSRLEGGLTFLEFNYMLLQSYDFLHLYRSRKCALFVGGSDQWSNALAGVDLVRRADGGKAFTLVTPLLTTASGQKMGKTESGAVWLDPGMTTPFDMYQYWINTDDRDVPRFLAFFTDLPMAQVRELGSLEGADLRRAKDVLALEATALAHGRLAAQDARNRSQSLFGADATAEAAPISQIHLADLDGLTTARLFVLSGLCDSKNAARRLIDQGGASVDGVKVASPDEPVDRAFLQRGPLLKAGKKRFTRIVLAAD